jgi:ribosomal-protein-alanine N-acetyltransferase
VEQLVNLNFNPYPTLFTERLILREITAVDYEDVFLLRSNPIVTKALDKVPFVKLEEAQAFVVFLGCLF